MNPEGGTSLTLHSTSRGLCQGRLHNTLLNSGTECFRVGWQQELQLELFKSGFNQ